MISHSDENSYKNAMLKESKKKKDPVPREEWSILSNHVKYVTHDESDAFHKILSTTDKTKASIIS